MQKKHLKYFNKIMCSLAKNLDYKGNKKIKKKEAIEIDLSFLSFVQKKFQLNGRFKSSEELMNYLGFRKLLS
jgi:hypothetical protein